jgi:hypothetical protein
MQALPMAPATPRLTDEEVTALRGEVRALAQERDAVILAHNYQVPEIQDVAHFVGDSLGLSRAAAAADPSTIVFCGVHFMAETASVLSPDKKVLIPRAKVAREVLPEKLRELGAKVVVPPAYQSVPASEGKEALEQRLLAGEIDCVTFTASSTVENFVRAFGGEEEIGRAHV